MQLELYIFDNYIIIAFPFRSISKARPSISVQWTSEFNLASSWKKMVIIYVRFALIDSNG